MATSIYGMIYDELAAMKKHNPQEFKQYAQGFDVLDREGIAGLILDGTTYWFEWSTYMDDRDIKKLVQIKKYLARKGWTYLYD